MKVFEPPRISPGQPVVIDTETDGLDWKRNKIVGYVLTLGPNWSMYYPTRHAEGENYDHDQVTDFISQVLGSGRKVVGHHLKFDLHMCLNEGLPLPRDLECTQINAALIDENARSFSLEAVGEALKVPVKKGQMMYEHLAGIFGGEPKFTQMENFWRLSADDPVVHEYAAGDGITTWHAWQAQQELLDHDDLWAVHALECRVIRTLVRMERNGVRVDEERLEWFKNWLQSSLDQALGALPEGLNVRSGPQIREYMEQRGYTNWPTTPKGNPSFTENWLKTFDDGKAIIRVRKLTNLGNSFLSPLTERHMFDGRVYTHFNQLKMDDYGTVTGRLSSSEPNMQQVPKRDKELAPLFRSIFLACDEGALWSANDYSQQEYRVFADYSREKLLINGYSADPPVDIHTVVAQLLNVERDPTGKRMNMGLLNSIGVEKLAAMIGVSVQEARRLKGQYMRKMPKVKSFNDKAIGRAKSRGWVMTRLGRRARLEFRSAHKAPSRIIQGTSADMTKQKMVEIDEYFEANGDVCKMMLQIHDDLSWSVPPGAEEQDAEAVRIMEDFGPNSAIPFDVPITVDHATAENWGKASFPKYSW